MLSDVVCFYFVDPIEYEIAEVNAILHMAQAGFAGSGGIKKVTHAYGILGFIKFLQGYYMILVTKRKKVGSFGAHLIYSIEDTCMVYLPHESAVSRVPLFQTNSIRADEARLLFFSYYLLFQDIRVYLW